MDTKDNLNSSTLNPVRILVCPESQVSELIDSKKYNFVHTHSLTASLSSWSTRDGIQKPKYLLFNSISYWASKSVEKEKTDAKEETAEVERIDIDSTLLHHLCLLPYLS